jgi:hypothetical protein
MISITLLSLFFSVAQAAEINRLIEQLGSPRFAEREAAHRRLAEHGLAARRALENVARKTADAEARRRSERLLDLLNAREAAKLGDTIDRLLQQNQREEFREWPDGSLVRSGWIFALPSGRGIQRCTLQEQAGPIIALGKDTVPHLLKWVRAPEWHVRYISRYSLQKITGLKPPVPLFNDIDRQKLEHSAVVIWKSWYESQPREKNAAKGKQPGR